MQYEDKSVVERTFLALADLARRSEASDISSEMIYDVVCEWTTDDIGPDGPKGIDSMVLGSFMVEHLATQVHLRDHEEDIIDLAISLGKHNIDPEKLIEQDPDEWNRLHMAIAVGPESEFSIEEGELTVDDILSASDPENVPHEGDWQQVGEQALLDKVDYQLFMNEVLAVFLQATVDEDSDRVHDIIDDMGCEVTHALANTLLIWVKSRSQLKDDETLDEWIAGLEAMAAQISELPAKDRIEFARDHLIGFDDLD